MPNALRWQVWRILEENSGTVGRLVNSSIILLVLANVGAEIVSTIPGYEARFHGFFLVFEVVSVLVFAIEYGLRIWIAVEDPRERYHDHPVLGRLRYMATAMSIIDLLAFLPYLIMVMTGVDLHFMRLLRLLKLLRYSSAIDTLTAAVRSERRALVSAGVVMLVLLVMLSSMAYHIEREAQPSAFSSIPAAMWWGVVTLTTVGYGDVVPQTPLGKLLGALTTMLGLIMFALPAGILASAFAQEIKKRDFVVTWSLVAKVPLFTELGAGRIADIAGLLSSRVAVPGERLVRKGDPADAMFFILEGEVDVELTPETVCLKAGDFFGEIALIAKTTRTATVRAATSCRLLSLSATDFNHLLIEHPELNEVLKKTAAKRLAELQALGAHS
jgi:voltage-gated potassium channel